MLKFRSNINGVRPLNNFIHNFRHLLLYSTSTSSSSSTSISISADPNPSFVNYLVEFLGFTKQQALSTSTKLVRYRHNRGTKNFSDFNFVHNADSVIKYLKQIGLDHSHTRNVVSSAPRILLCKVDKTLIPKTQAFLKMGFSGSDFADIVKVNPSLFFPGLNNVIVPAIQALREILGSDSDVIAFLKRSHNQSIHSISRYLVPNVALLQNYGIPIELIRKRLIRSQTVFSRKTENFEDILIRVEEKLGIPRGSPQFLFGVHLLVSSNENTILSKREVYKSFGWTESDIVALFKICPNCFGLSAATIKKKLGFFMTELGYQPDFLVSYSCLLTYSLEKRIVPRHKVILVLKEKGFISLDYRLQSAMIMTDSRFLEKFVLPFKEAHEVYSKHAGLSMEVLTQDR